MRNKQRALAFPFWNACFTYQKAGEDLTNLHGNVKMGESRTKQAEHLFGSTGGSHPLGRLTDQRETYGPKVVEDLVRNLDGLRTVVDLGAGTGRYLAIVRRFHPNATLIAVEGGQEYAKNLVGKADQVVVANRTRPAATS